MRFADFASIKCIYIKYFEQCHGGPLGRLFHGAFVMSEVHVSPRFICVLEERARLLRQYETSRQSGGLTRLYHRIAKLFGVGE